MKIDSATVELSASRQAASRVDVSERLNAWVGTRPQASDVQGNRRSVVVSDAARQALELDPATATADRDDTKLDPKLELLKSIVEVLTGQRIDILSADALTAGQTAAAQSSAQADFGVEYDRTETRTEAEAMQFEAGGTIRTSDGQEIGFHLSLSMARVETETRSLSLRAGNAVASKDPLVINFDGAGASLTSQRFSFDLMGDGRAVDMPVLGQGSGFLVLDANQAGKVQSGRQLFGPASGDGFADLARYDSDANGWIDENDPVFGRLGVWTPDGAGGGAVASLGERGVGALYLGRAASAFTLKDAGQLLGAVRSSGLYVREDGGVGAVQQVDVVA